uniref:Ribonuclease H-like domain-containing protein n=1 Tax=Tanacetum cinerariifolium TaxID=118510 RepID=A0A6L2KIA3_TANCI|nr:ribonuclease H-like domain-containing protein [Tanacetum cinerariifolium]
MDLPKPLLLQSCPFSNRNGNSLKSVAQTTTNDAGTSTTLIPGPVTTEEKVQKINDVKARSMLLMVLPNEYLMTFNQYKDAKTMFAAIQTRFGGKEAIKKTQKTLLKQMHEKFSATSTESFDSIFNSTNEVYTTYGVSTSSTQSSTTSTQVGTASTQTSTTYLSDATVYAFLSNQLNGSHLVHEDLEQIHEDDLEEMDLKWQLALLSMRAKSRKGVWFVSYNAVLPPPIGLFSPPKLDLSNSDLKEFQQPEFESYRPKTSKNANEDIPNKLKEYPDALLVKDRVLDNKDCSIESPIVVEKKIIVSTIAKVKVVRPKQQEKLVRKIVRYAKMYRSQVPRENQRNWNNLKSQQLGSNFVMYNKACFVCRSFKHVQANYNYHQRKRVVIGNNYTRVHSNNSSRKTHPSAHRNMAPRAVLMKTSLRPINTAKPVNTAYLKTTVNSTSPMSRFLNQHNQLPRAVNTARPRAANTGRPNSAVVNAVRANPRTCPISLSSKNLMEDMLPLGEEQMVAELLVKELLRLIADTSPVDKKKVIITEISVRSDLYLEDVEDEHVTTTSNDPLLSGNQALEIRSLERRVKKLEKKGSKRTSKLKRLYKIGMFDTSILDDEEVVTKKEVSTADPVTTAGEVVTTVGVEVSTAAITSQIYMDEITLAKALIDIKTSKPKAKGIVMQEPSETPTPTPIDSSQQPSKAKDKDTDHELAARLKEKERGDMTIEEKSSKKAKEGSSKRAGGKLEQEDAKRHMIKEENEYVKLKRCLEIIPDDVIIKATPLSSKSLTIVDYKIYKEGRKSFFKIIRADVKKMYPFTRNILHKMWNAIRLHVDYEVEMAYDLLRLIRRQISEGYAPE